MIKGVARPAELPNDRPVCVAIGMFDGVHLGHRKVIQQTLADAQRQAAEPVVITFDRHPNSIVAPQRTPPLIYPLSHRIEILRDLGINRVHVLCFDLPLSQTPAERFVRDLAAAFGRLLSLSVGQQFSFGHKRSGNIGLLKTMGAELRFSVNEIPGESLADQVISSTRIRQTIQDGDFAIAGRLLGRPYRLIAPVIHGDHLGRKLGFPTANLDFDGLAIPPNGVYAARVTVHGEPNQPAVLNLGVRPTLTNNQPQSRLEVHLLDFDGDLYGKELAVEFVQRVRGEQKFDSPESLRKQIALDIGVGRRILETIETKQP